MTTTTQRQLVHLTIDEISELIKSGVLSPVELLHAYLDRIEKFDGKVGAFINLMADSAMDQAKAAEVEIGAGKYRGPLHGITFAVKDQLDSEGAPSYMRGPTGPMHNEDATAIARLKDAGAIYMGKLVMSGQPGVPQPSNPWDLERTTGGSSSGSGAAVAAGFCTATLGEDSAGSIRNPASLCGLVGVIGTYGRVSRFGLASMGWTVDHCGPLAATVKDAAYVLEAMAGYDPRDPKTSRESVPQFSTGLDGGIKGLKIGVPRADVESPAMNVRPEVMAAFNGALEVLKDLGAAVVEIDLPLVEESTFLSFVIYTGEYFAEYMGQLEWFSENDREGRLGRMGLGALTGAGDYLHAQKLRAHMRAEFKKILGDVDLIATPSLAATAAKTSEMVAGGREWWKRPGFAAMFNVTGLPALTAPCGFDSQGLPIGLQLGGRPFGEATVLKAAHAYEQSTPWHTMRAEF